MKSLCPTKMASAASNKNLESSALNGRLAVEVCRMALTALAFTSPTANGNVPTVWCPSVAETAFQVTVYTPSLRERRETVMRVVSDGSTRTSPTSTLTLFVSITLIELSCGSNDSLKNSSTCTGGSSRTALACGLERNNTAWAQTEVTAHAL